jgi:hypothetical protein
MDRVFRNLGMVIHTKEVISMAFLKAMENIVGFREVNTVEILNKD